MHEVPAMSDHCPCCGLPDSKREPPWISVSERLPEDGVRVMKVDATKGEWNEPWIGEWGPASSVAPVTHWAPLPDLPT